MGHNRPDKRLTPGKLGSGGLGGSLAGNLPAAVQGGVTLGTYVPKPLVVQTFEPYADLVVLQVVKFANVTDTGLELPENMKNQWSTPVLLVIAAGPDCKYAKPGDQVLPGVDMVKTLIVFGPKRQETLLVKEEQLGGRVLPEFRAKLPPPAPGYEDKLPAWYKAAMTEADPGCPAPSPGPADLADQAAGDE